jgi:hypothetical protein
MGFVKLGSSSLTERYGRPSLERFAQAAPTSAGDKNRLRPPSQYRISNSSAEGLSRSPAGRGMVRAVTGQQRNPQGFTTAFARWPHHSSTNIIMRRKPDLEEKRARRRLDTPQP